LNRFATGLGLVLLVMGILTHLLLGLLKGETFRAGFVIWQYTGYGLIVGGIVLSIVSFVLPPFRSGRIDSRVAAKYFGYAALINSVAAAAFTLPLLYPPFEFPILITEWPGIYMIIAYSFFIIFGVLGMLGWSFVYSQLSVLISKENLSTPIIILQLIIANIGIYGAAIFLFLGGLQGSHLAYIGAGSIIVGASMEFSDIPSAFSIFLCVLSVLIGVVNFARAK
jgi:hypothetical protein